MSIKHPIKLFLLHLLCLVMLVIGGPFHFLASLFTPLFGTRYKKWIDYYLPSFKGYMNAMW